VLGEFGGGESYHNIGDIREGFVKFKGTVSVISSDHLCKDYNPQFTKIPLNLYF